MLYATIPKVILLPFPKKNILKFLHILGMHLI
jgi:hypothetical protein